MALLLSYIFIHTQKKLENIHRSIDYNQGDNYGGGGEGAGLAIEPRDFHILSRHSLPLHLQSWKSLIYPLPVYLCFLNLPQETQTAFITTKKKKSMLFSMPMCYIFRVGAPPNNSLWCCLCFAHFFLKSYYFVFSNPPILDIWKEERP